MTTIHTVARSGLTLLMWLATLMWVTAQPDLKLKKKHLPGQNLVFAHFFSTDGVVITASNEVLSYTADRGFINVSGEFTNFDFSSVTAIASLGIDAFLLGTKDNFLWCFRGDSLFKIDEQFGLKGREVTAIEVGFQVVNVSTSHGVFASAKDIIYFDRSGYSREYSQLGEQSYYGSTSFRLLNRSRRTCGNVPMGFANHLVSSVYENYFSTDEPDPQAVEIHDAFSRNTLWRIGGSLNTYASYIYYATNNGVKVHQHDCHPRQIVTLLPKRRVNDIFTYPKVSNYGLPSFYFFGTDKGLHVIDDPGSQLPSTQTTKVSIVGSREVYSVSHSFCDNTIWVATDDGLFEIEFENQQPSYGGHRNDYRNQLFCESGERQWGLGRSEFQYQWLLNDEIIPGATDNSVIVKEPGVYKQIYTGCYTSDTITWARWAEDVNATAVITPDTNVVSCRPVTLRERFNRSDQEYQWFKDGTAITNGTYRNLLVTETGDYHLEAMTCSGVIQVSSPVTVEIVEAVPTPEIDPIYAQSAYCIGDSMRLTNVPAGARILWGDGVRIGRRGPLQYPEEYFDHDEVVFSDDFMPSKVRYESAEGCQSSAILINYKRPFSDGGRPIAVLREDTIRGCGSGPYWARIDLPRFGSFRIQWTDESQDHISRYYHDREFDQPGQYTAQVEEANGAYCWTQSISVTVIEDEGKPFHQLRPSNDSIDFSWCEPPSLVPFNQYFHLQSTGLDTVFGPLTTNSLTLPAENWLEKGKTYEYYIEWRQRGIKTETATLTIDEWNLQVPATIAPGPYDAYTTGSDISFTWDDRNTDPEVEYNVIITQPNNLDTLIYSDDKTHLLSTVQTFPPSTSPYKWRVEAFNDLDTITSESQLFYVTSADSLTLQPTKPIDGAVLGLEELEPETLQFEWVSPFDTGHFVQVQGPQVDTLLSALDADTIHLENLDFLVANETYRWRVLAKREFDSLRSDWHTFSIQRNAEITGSSNSNALKGVRFSHSEWVDFNEDGYLDLSLSGTKTGSSSNRHFLLYENDQNGELLLRSDDHIPLTIYGEHDWGDLNNDGFPDMVLTGTTSGFNRDNVTNLYLNDGTGKLDLIGVSLPKMSRGSVDIVDIDNDGWKDIFLIGLDEDLNFAASIFRNNADSTFTFIEHLGPNGSDRYNFSRSQSVWLDINGDGLQDLIYAYAFGNRLSGFKAFINRGDFHLSELRYWATGQSGFSYYHGITMTPLDFNNDGWMDLALSGTRGELGSSTHPARLYVLENGGNNVFHTFWTEYVGTYNGGIDAADINNDGYTDILLTGAGNGTRSSHIIYNLGGEDFLKSNSADLENLSFGGITYGQLAPNQDPAILVHGEPSGNGDEVSVILELDHAAVNAPPSTPSNLKYEVSDGNFVISWDASTDDITPMETITYNIKVNEKSSNDPRVVAESSGNGYLKMVDYGNVGFNTKFTHPVTREEQVVQVQAIDNAFNASAFSAALTIGCDQIYLLSPANNEAVSDKGDVHFSWCLSSAADFTVTIQNSTSFDTTFTTSDQEFLLPSSTLIQGTTYDWTITDNLTSAKQSASFTVVNGPPDDFKQVFPRDRLHFDPYRPVTFSWSESLDKEEITYGLVLNNLQEDTVIWTTNQSFKMINTPYFVPNSRFDWWVLATDGKDTTKTEQRSLFTLNDPPKAFGLTSAPSVDVKWGQNLDLEWSEAHDLDQVTYSVYLINGSDSTGIYYGRDRSTSYIFRAADYTTSSSWQVRAIADDWKDKTFTPPLTINLLNDTPTAANLISPLDSAEIEDSDLTFTWNTAQDENVLTYTLQVFEEQTLVKSVTSRDTLITFDADELRADTWYNWLVLADDSLATTPSGSRNFRRYTPPPPEEEVEDTTATDGTLALLELYTPADNTTAVQGSDLVFSWKEEPGNTYTLIINDTLQFDVEGTQKTITLNNGLTKGQNFEWRVKANQDSLESEKRLFRVINDAPSGLTLMEPANNHEINDAETLLLFRWSAVVDLDAVQYHLTLTNTTGVAKHFATSSTDLSVKLDTIDLVFDEGLEWQVIATDGEDSTRSSIRNLTYKQDEPLALPPGLRGALIYPNPAKERITVVAREPGFAKLYDLTGRLVHQLRLETHSQEANLSHLQDGTYLLVVENDQLEEIQKFKLLIRR